MRFADTIGHEETARGLVRSHRDGRMPHALLLLGPEGNGALPLARAFAQFLNCAHPGEHDSCGTCPSCLKAAKAIHPDIHYSYPFLAVGSGPKSQQKRSAGDWAAEWREALAEQPWMGYDDWVDRMDHALGGTNKQANIPVDEVQAIQARLRLKSFEGGYKVLILWLPEYLDKEGNRLLKLIEEPPPRTLFLLVAEDADRILNTILSRTQIVRVPRLPDAVVAAALTERFGLEAGAAEAAARLAEGNLRKALAARSGEAGELAALWERWLGAAVRWQVVSLFQTADDIHKLGREAQKQLFRLAGQRARACWLRGLGLPGGESVSDAEARLLPPAGWERFTADLDKGAYYLERNANARLVMTNLGIRLSRMVQRARHGGVPADATP